MNNRKVSARGLKVGEKWGERVKLSFLQHAFAIAAETELKD